MAASEQNDIENEPQADNAAETWYSERQSRIASERARVEAQTALFERAYGDVENQWQQLNTEEEWAHDTVDTKELFRLQSERQRLLGEADKLKNGYQALQSENQQIEFADRVAKLDYQSLYDIVPEKSKLFMQVFRDKLNSPAALKKLLHADSIAGAKYEPCSNYYYAAVEQHMGFKSDERKFTFENEHEDEMRASTNATRRDGQAKVKATEAQKVMAHNLPGISADEYLAACAQPFSNAAQTVSLEPDELNFSNNSKGMNVSFDEAPKQTPARYRQPSPKSSVNLSPAELSLIEHMATQTGQSLQEARTEFAKQKLALHSGKSSHMLYEDRLKAMGQA